MSALLEPVTYGLTLCVSFIAGMVAGWAYSDLHPHGQGRERCDDAARRIGKEALSEERPEVER